MKVRRQAEGIEPSIRGRRFWRTSRYRCFLRANLEIETSKGSTVYPFYPPLNQFADQRLREIIHLPGLHGNPDRNYQVTAVGRVFPGTFDTYVASVLANWQLTRDHGAIDAVNEDMRILGLPSNVVARRLSDAEVEIQVGRAMHSVRANSDLVSIADVGIGVSQTLPVVVALHAASERHLVYLEQPEIHLHPRAQVALASVLASAVDRGVRNRGREPIVPFFSWPCRLWSREVRSQPTF